MTSQRPITTTRGYDLFEVISAMQKGIRRGDARLAGYWAIELVESGFGAWAWRRLLTISAEDVAEPITLEIEALHRTWTARGRKDTGSIFVAKAVLLLAQAMKSRDADHLVCLVYSRRIGTTDQELLKDLEEARAEAIPMAEAIPIPAYALDYHTRRGRKAGKTKEQFFIDEHDALEPRIAGLFDDLLEIQRKKTMREE
jgi:replication-associated recombination protein RarA